MLLENTLFGTVDKVADAIKLLQLYEPPEGYYVCFSGGKDSVVILDLVKRAGVKFEAHHHILTIEQPELMHFIFSQYPDVINDHPPKSMYQLIQQFGCPPHRHIRYCCWNLKTIHGKGRFKVDGVRAAESPRRAKRQKIENDTKNVGGRFLHLIFDWSSDDVWQYIHTRNLPYCKLYDEGLKRIGCVFCPFAKPADNIANVKRYPQFARYFITACDRAIKSRIAKGKDSKYKTGQEMFDAWIFGGRYKNSKEVFSMINSAVSTSLTLTNAATPAIFLDQRVIKIQFHLQNMANSAIIIGQELTECKKEVGHGNWTIWLKDNFNLSQDTATNFMRIAERFSNSESIRNLGVTQMIQLLKLPEGEEENFIAEKAAEGTPVEDMTVKKLRAEIKDWKKKAENQKTRADTAEDILLSCKKHYAGTLKAYNDSLFELQADKKVAEDNAAKWKAEAEKIATENEELKNKPPQVIETVKTMLPPGYVETVQRAEELQQQVDQLLEQNQDLQNQVIDAASKQGEPKIEFATPSDYDDIKKQLATLQAEKDTLKIDTAFLQALNQFFMAANFLHQHKDRAEHNLKIFFDDDPMTPQRVIQISDIANIFNNIIKKLSN